MRECYLTHDVDVFSCLACSRLRDSGEKSEEKNGGGGKCARLGRDKVCLRRPYNLVALNRLSLARHFSAITTRHYKSGITTLCSYKRFETNNSLPVNFVFVLTYDATTSLTSGRLDTISFAQLANQTFKCIVRNVSRQQHWIIEDHLLCYNCQSLLLFI